MRYVFGFIFLFVCFMGKAQDTFSIVAADPETGEVGAAGATCIDGAASIGGAQIISQIIPGRGGINAQAWICIPNINLTNAIDQMDAGLSPDELIVWLQANDACSSQGFNPAYRQYGIVDFDENMEVRTTTFTGSQADEYKGGVAGINYAIQGNILLGPEIIEGIEAGFNNTEGSLAAKLMGAMQGANVPGADSRCLGRGTSSTTAFLKVYKADDDIWDPYVNFNILEMPFGQEPIDSLQSLFDTWVLSTLVIDPADIDKVIVYPNPVTYELTIGQYTKGNYNSYEIISFAGQQVQKGTISSQTQKLDIRTLATGVYFLLLRNESGLRKDIKFVVR